MKKIWDWIIEQLGKIRRDRLYHFIAGLIIAAFFGLTLGMKACVIPVIFVAFLKEFIDELRYGGFDWIDLAWTCGGGLIIQLFAIL